MKYWLKDGTDWKAVKKKYRLDPGQKKHHQTVLHPLQKRPWRYPCCAVGSVEVFMTEANWLSFEFAYDVPRKRGMRAAGRP